VSADSRYLLFINGQRIGFGPARCDPRWQAYDEYESEIVRALRPGRNVIAALVHHVGESTCSYILGRSAFLFEADIDVKGQKVEPQRDHTWRVFPGLPWQYVPHRLSLETDFPEIYDARLEPAGWNTTNFDDSHWVRPTLIGPPPVAPWGEMEPRDIPFFRRDTCRSRDSAGIGPVDCDGERVFGRHARRLRAARGARATRRFYAIGNRARGGRPRTAGTWFVIRDANPYEVTVNGQMLHASAAPQSGDSGHQTKGAFMDCRTDESLSQVVSQPANSLAVLFGVAPEGAEPAIMNYVLNPVNKVAPVGSPYFSFYLLSALYRTGMHDRALEYIRTQWGRMLDVGATTWWEGWDGKQSLCHGWSAGPTYDLMAEFVGIKALTPGFRKVLVRPNPVGLQSASAKVPALPGDITAGWRVAGGEFTPDLDLPRENGRTDLPAEVQAGVEARDDGWEADLREHRRLATGIRVGAPGPASIRSKRRGMR
jgi:hypothetical protein